MKKEIILIFLLLALAAFFRFYRAADYLYFTVDEERDAFIMKKILTDLRPTLIGPAVPHLTYLGPFYFNFSAIIFALTNMDLIKMGYAASFIGVINACLLFLAARSIFKQRIAYAAALIYAVSFLVVIYNRNYWPLTYTQLAVLGAYYCLNKILKGNYRFIYWLAIPLIIGVQSTPTAFSLIPLSLAVILIKKINFKKALVPLILLFASHIPWLIFDFRHDHLLLKMLTQYFSATQRAVIHPAVDLWRPFELVFLSFIRALYIFGPPDSSRQIAPIGNYFIFRAENIPRFFYFAAFLCLIYLFFRIKDKRLFLPLAHTGIVILGVFAYNFFFPGYTFEWFTDCLFPVFAILWAYIIVEALKKRVLIYAALILIMVFNLRAIIIGGNSFSIKTKLDAVRWSSRQVRGKNFELLSIGGWQYGGYRFLFERYGAVPVKSYMDGAFAGWVYPKNNLKPEKKVIFVSEMEFRNQVFLKEYQSYIKQAKERKKFGNIEVIII